MFRSFLTNFDVMAFYGNSLMVGTKRFVGNFVKLILVEVYNNNVTALSTFW